ncbi:MAG: NACHT domain-containing NTPase, partial [Hormoscilla sp.]
MQDISLGKFYHRVDTVRKFLLNFGYHQEKSEKSMASRLWRFLNTDIRELFSAETIAEGTEAAEAVLELANTLQEEGANVQQLAPLVGNISTLLDVLNSPLGEIVGAGLPFVSIAAKLLAFYLEKTQKPPTLEQGVALVSQAAYLESLQEFLKKDSDLLSRIGQTPVSAPVQQQIKQLSELELDEDDAKRAVVCFHDCKLAEVFGQVLLARLQDAGLDEEEAQILTARVAWNTYRYMMSAWGESGDAVQHLPQPSFNEWRQELTKYQSIEDYLTEQIATKPLENVFGEDFTFRDIYVPLKAKPLDENGNEVYDAEAFDLENWANNVLQDPEKQDRVMFVQGGPGRGKSVFSRMFADWVGEKLYPIWIPVLIRLRDIPKLQESFTNTLRDAVSAKFAGDDWLKDRNTKYLFLLDGFDELLLEGRTSGGLEQFLRQVSQFQRDSQQGKDMGHRVLITGRTLALQGIERQMPDNLERVRIQVMDSQLQQQWLDKWERIFDRATREAFEAFLQDGRCPERVQELAREPLLLYLLAAMHRDRELQVEDFEGASSTIAKIKIYEKFLDWVLKRQRPEWLTRQLTEQEIDDLRRILSEAGLCVVQSGGEFASVKAIEFRLKQDEGAKALLEEAQKRIGDDPLRNALATFYLQKGSQEGSVEFAHKSFGEFLCADRLKESIIEWTELGKKRKKFDIPEEQLHWEIYDLLGYGALTPEIVEYLMGLLTASEEFRPVELFERLNDFYFRWCDGEFIDAPPENLPQKKMRQLREQGIQLGQRQVDVYAGLNVMILLLELHRYGQEREDLKDKIVFYLCGEPNSEGE